MKGIIDRFEENFAVIEANEKFINIEKSKLPKDAKEGDVITFEGESIQTDKEETLEKRKKIKEKISNIFQ